MGNGVVQRCKFKYIRSHTSAADSVDLLLCLECFHNLTNANNSTAGLQQYTWIAYIYYLLKYENIKDRYGSTIWRLLPIQ